MSNHYNLIVDTEIQLREDGTGSVQMPKERYLEHTVPEIKEQHSMLNFETLQKIKMYPTLIMHEKEVNDSVIANITEVEVLQKHLNIYFYVNSNYKPIPSGTVKSLMRELDINRGEWYRTHWAIKNVSFLPFFTGYCQNKYINENEILQFKDGILRTKESAKTEFKETFEHDLRHYLKTIMSFANNKGGNLIFGVKDNPREFIGLKPDEKFKFNNLDEADIENLLGSYCSERIDVEKNISTQHGTECYYVKVAEAKRKPIICAKDWEKGNKKIFAGDIYFRYSGKSEKIKYTDLQKIVEHERDKERKIFIDLLSTIAKIGPENIGLLSAKDNNLNFHGQTIAMDENLIDRFKFVREGNFVQKKGAPTLVLKGDIEGIKSATIIKETIDPNTTHPHEGRDDFLKAFMQKYNSPVKVSFRGHKYSLKHIFSTIFKHEHKIEENKDYFWSNSKRTDKKYSDVLLSVFKSYLDDNKKPPSNGSET